MTNLVKATNSFTVVDLAEGIHHAQILLTLWQSGFIYVRVLQTQSSLYNPDGVSHDQCEDPSLGCCHHM